MAPPERTVVLCVDEKSQTWALVRTQPMLPLRPGTPAWQTHDYKRHGTMSLFAALDIATGEVIGRCYPRHRSVEFRKFLTAIEKSVSRALDIHFVLEDYSHPQDRHDPQSSFSGTLDSTRHSVQLPRPLWFFGWRNREFSCTDCTRPDDRAPFSQA